MDDSQGFTLHLILVPSVITLAVTLLRLIGELAGWSKWLFNTAAGGGGALVGIVWLVPIFGIYFALKLGRAGEGPRAVGRAILFAALGFVLLASGFVLLNFVFGYHLRYMVLMWLLGALGAAVQFLAWPKLSKVLLVYAYAARIPVAVIMYLATEYVWQSHYSALILPEFQLSPMRQYFLFGFCPQLVWWVSFTVIVGALTGSITAALSKRGRPAGDEAVAGG